MIIRLACKLFDEDSKYFLNPILISRKIKKVILYRDTQPLHLKSDIYDKLEGVYNNTILKFLIRLFRIINDKKPDLYIGIYEIPHGLFALIGSWFNNKPSVVSIIGNPRFKIRNKGFRKYLTNYIYKSATVLTVTGSESKNFLINKKSISSEKIFILPNSISTEKYKPIYIEKKYDLITLGRLSPEKGLYKLIDIIYILKKKIPNISVAIAGSGPIYDNLDIYIKKLGLKNNIRLLGYVTNSVKFLNQGKLFITTSFSEGLPRSVIQSMACKTPVIATDVGDMKDVIINGKTGYLINRTDSNEKIAEETYKILISDKSREFFASNSYKHINLYFTHEAAKKVWEKIFKYLNCQKIEK